MPNTVLLRGDPIASEGTVATAVITPGMAVTPAGDSVVRSAANAVAPGFARENELVGKGIDDDYAVGDRILYYTPRKGDWFYAWLGTSQEIAAGALLSTGANGVLVAADPGDPEATPPEFATPVVARALEAVTTTGEIARIKVEVV